MTLFSARRVLLLALLVLGAISFSTSASAWARFDADEPAAPEAAEGDKAAAEEPAAEEPAAEEPAAEEPAAEDPAAEEPAAAEATPTPEAPAKDIYAVPEGASAKDLVRFIEELKVLRNDFKSQDEQKQHIVRSLRAMLSAAELILASEPDEEIAGTALKTQIMCYWNLYQSGDTTALPKLTALAETLKADSRVDVAADANLFHLAARMVQVSADKPDETRQLITDVIGELKKEPLDARLGELVDEIVKVLQRTGQPELELEAYQSSTNALSGSENPRIKGMVEQWEAHIRRLTLVGGPIDVEGSLVGGETFDWSAYKGKVVLVDFWATWCGPCIAEMPNVRESYEKFHAQGFEVIGISIDNDKATLDAFIAENKVPWPILFDTVVDGPRSTHPMATKYGIMFIPAAILVAPDGNVVTLNARGEELPKLVEELLAKVEQATEPKTKTSAKAPAKAKTPAKKN